MSQRKFIPVVFRVCGDTGTTSFEVVDRFRMFSQGCPEDGSTIGLWAAISSRLKAALTLERDKTELNVWGR
jgi:hypothetical protein